MENKSLNISFTSKEFVTIIAALYAQMKRSPLFVEECSDVCYHLTSVLVRSCFYKDKDAVR